MQHTYKINSKDLNASFLESIRTLFGQKNLTITVRDVEEQTELQLTRFNKSESIRQKLKGFKVDPNLDLSELANDVNL